MSNTCPDTDLAQGLSQEAEAVVQECRGVLRAGGVGGWQGVTGGLARLEGRCDQVSQHLYSQSVILIICVLTAVLCNVQY